jgi:peptide/nickel transport system permease protein
VKDFWHKYQKDKLAVAGLYFFILLVLIAFFGIWFRPDNTTNSNDQHTEWAKLKPGSTVTYTNHNGEKAQKTFWLGTDRLGRDVFSRLILGTQVSIVVGIVAVVFSLIIGLLIGIPAGYYRGWVDALFSWFINVFWAIPGLLVVMAFVLAFGTGFWKVFIAVGLTMWVEVARIARGQVLSVREMEYIEAAKTIGVTDWNIMLKHILPNILPPIIIICAANFSSAILLESGLSFLGLGVQIPAPSWGNMIRENYHLITGESAYLALIPGFLIMLTVLSLMFVGNGLRRAWDVKENM